MEGSFFFPFSCSQRIFSEMDLSGSGGFSEGSVSWATGAGLRQSLGGTGSSSGMFFSLQFSALKSQFFISIEGVLRSTKLKCCGQM